ncbi:MAG TPA: hypothetical protein VM619_02635 [Luteimonas sp.]|nr:hypothetical protein [Luteimonas sp.]
MPNNPYAEAVERWFSIVIGVLGSITCLLVVVLSFIRGTAPGFGRRHVTAPIYTLADNPSQFWFGVLVYAAAAAIFGWIAWRAYRG